MLEYTKTVLQKVSFNRELFSKELGKAFKWLHKEELILLQAWCVVTFSDTYQDVISEAFRNLT